MQSHHTPRLVTLHQKLLLLITNPQKPNTGSMSTLIILHTTRTASDEGKAGPILTLILHEELEMWVRRGRGGGGFYPGALSRNSKQLQWQACFSLTDNQRALHDGGFTTSHSLCKISQATAMLRKTRNPQD